MVVSAETSEAGQRKSEGTDDIAESLGGKLEISGQGRSLTHCFPGFPDSFAPRLSHQSAVISGGPLCVVSPVASPSVSSATPTTSCGRSNLRRCWRSRRPLVKEQKVSEDVKCFNIINIIIVVVVISLPFELKISRVVDNISSNNSTVCSNTRQ